MNTKRLSLFVVLAMFLCLANYSIAAEIKTEGTIQGLLSTCAGKACSPGEEMIIAAMEQTYVLLTDTGKYYLLPNLKSSQLSPYLNKRVRVEGDLKLGGNAIMVKTADVREGGTWQTFWSPEIYKMQQMQQKGIFPGG